MDRTATQQYYRESIVARRIALLIVAIGSFLVPLALAASIVAIPAIAADLNASAVLVSGIPTVYVLGQIITLIPAGRLADRYGRKRIFIQGSILFMLSTVLSGLTGSIEALLFFRLLQGIASGMIFSTGLAIVSSVFRGNNSGMALGITVAMIYLGMVCGPLLGGWLTEHYGWRTVFFFQAPFAALTILLTLTALKGEWSKEDPAAVDWVGTFLFGLWSSGLFVGIAQLPDPSAWLIFPATLLCFLLFIYQQKHTDTPLVKVKIIRTNRLFSSSILAAVCMYTGNYTLIFLLSLYLQYNQGLSPAASGQLIVFQALSMVILAPLTGYFSDRYPSHRISTTGCILVALSFMAFLSLDGETSRAFIIAALLVMGVGFGLFSTPNSNAALSSVPEEHLAMGSALLNLARLLGNMIGTVIIALLMAVYIGQTQISPEQYPALLNLIHWAMGISALFALMGAWFSFARGKS